MRYFIHFVFGILLIQAPFAESIEASIFETEGQQSRYTQLIENIRCPVCQGQSIGGSNSGLAKDLREKVREMILDGQSDPEIYSYMVERYGDFVVYKPPVNTKTYLLWFAPLFILILSLMFCFALQEEIKKKQSMYPVTLREQKNY